MRVEKREVPLISRCKQIQYIGRKKHPLEEAQHRAFSLSLSAPRLTFEFFLTQFLLNVFSHGCIFRFCRCMESVPTLCCADKWPVEASSSSEDTAARRAGNQRAEVRPHHSDSSRVGMNPLLISEVPASRAAPEGKGV